jgi:hypothetical protein
MQRSRKRQHFQGQLFATSGQEREMGSSEVCHVLCSCVLSFRTESAQAPPIITVKMVRFPWGQKRERINFRPWRTRSQTFSRSTVNKTATFFSKTSVPDPDPLVEMYGSGSFYRQIVRKILIYRYCFVGSL